MRRLLIFLFLVVIVISTSLHSDSLDIKKHSIGAFESLQSLFPEVEEKESTIDTILFVGDVMLARHVETLMNRYGSNYPFSELPKVSSTTLLVGNFEASIPEKHTHTPDYTFSFSVATSHIPALLTYGFTHFGLANNHTFDYGSAGFENTKKELSSFAIFGHPEKSDSSITFTKIGSSTVALVALSFVDKTYSDEELQSIFIKTNEKSDMQIAYVHWGTEYQQTHSSSQEHYAKKLIDVGGFDAIIGHHPHVVQDVQIYNGALIFYSLGNFIFDQYFSDEVQTGLMVDVSLDAMNKFNFKLHPVTSIGSRSVPRFMANNEKELFLADLAKSSDVSLSDNIKKGLIVSP